MAQKNIPVTNARIQHLEALVQRLYSRLGLDDFSPSADPLASTLSSSLQKPTETGLRRGKVHVAVPYLNSYLVAIEGGGLMPCGMMGGTSSPQALGPRAHQTISPDTDVAVWMHPSASWGYIVGTLPIQVEDGSSSVSDFVSQGGGVGVRRESYYLELLRQLGTRSGLVDFSDQAPMDQLLGDYTLLTELGGGLHIDAKQSFLRVDEVCGLYCHQIDQLLQLMAYNYDFNSAAKEERHRVDLLECYSEAGVSPYLWETMGRIGYSLNSVRREVDDRDVQFYRAEGKFEPTVADLAPFRRYQEYGGFLGTGAQRRMAVPPVDAELFRESESTKIPGVFLEHIDLNGQYTVRSAKGICLEKYNLISQPKRIRRPEDYSAQADSIENGNYQHAGIDAEGQPTQHCRDLGHPGDDPKSLKSAAGVFDSVSYTADWLPNNAFHYHQGDFYLPEESEHPLNVAQAPIPVEALLNKSFIDYSDWQEGFEQKLHVDHKHDSGEGVSYFANRAGMYITDDGTIVLRAGSGGEIRISENIVMSAPGNIELHSGKNVVTFAGYDVILKAKKNIEQSATDGSVLVKAERDLQMVSGNGGTGGTLIENRASGEEQKYPSEGGDSIEASGIVLKASQSDVATISRNAYIRTGNSDGNVGEGNIILDASKGSREIRTISSNLVHQLRGRAEFTFGNNSVEKISVIDRNGPVWDGDVRVKGAIHAIGGVQAIGNIASILGSVSSAAGGDMGRVLDGSARANQISSLITEVLSEIRANAQSAQSEFDAQWYAANRIGGGNTQRNISFCFRTSRQLGTLNFALTQNNWQILCEGLSALEGWQENPVYYQSPGNLRMSYPGHETWQSEEAFLMLPPESHMFYDVAAGRSKPRQAVENPMFGSFQRGPIQGNYKILRKPNG